MIRAFLALRDCLDGNCRDPFFLLPCGESLQLRFRDVNPFRPAPDEARRDEALPGTTL